MTNAITIRTANESDLEKTAALFDAYRVFYKRESDLPAAQAFLRARYGKNEIITFLAEDKTGKPLGFANIYPTFSSVSMGPVWTLNDLYVAPEARRTGLAQQIMQTVENEARKNGIIAMQLETAPDNHPAQACYESQGWKPGTMLGYTKAIKEN